MTVSGDPTRTSLLRPLRHLLAAMDDDIARLYADQGVTEVRPRFSMALIRLHHRGAMTIRELAREIDVTHSAMSQTVTELRRQELVDTLPGPDARTRVITLTARGSGLVPLLEAEWKATERAIALLDSEIPYPLTQVVRDLTAALERRSFYHRIVDQLPPGPRE